MKDRTSIVEVINSSIEWLLSVLFSTTRLAAVNSRGPGKLAHCAACVSNPIQHSRWKRESIFYSVCWVHLRGPSAIDLRRHFGRHAGRFLRRFKHTCTGKLWRRRWRFDCDLAPCYRAAQATCTGQGSRLNHEALAEPLMSSADNAVVWR